MQRKTFTEEYGDFGILSRIKSWSTCSKCFQSKVSDMRNKQQDNYICTDPRDIESVPPDKKAALNVNNLWKEFPSAKRGGSVVRAVRGLELQVYEGEVTCLLGPNGAGKSTFLNMLMGLSKPNEGNIKVYDCVC